MPQNVCTALQNNPGIIRCESFTARERKFLVTKAPLLIEILMKRSEILFWKRKPLVIDAQFTIFKSEISKGDFTANKIP